MQIRLANIGDAETISALNADVQKIHADALPRLFKQPSKEVFSPSAVIGLLVDPSSYIYVGSVAGKDIGYIFAEVRNLPETPFRYAMDLVYIHHISINPEYQHKGYGEKLIEAINTLAREKGISTIALDVWSFNTGAHTFFSKQGFTYYNARMWLEIAE